MTWKLLYASAGRRLQHDPDRHRARKRPRRLSRHERAGHAQRDHRDLLARLSVLGDLVPGGAAERAAGAVRGRRASMARTPGSASATSPCPASAMWCWWSLLLSTIWTTNGFENVWLLTQGGPSDATMTFPVLAYFGLQSLRIGEAVGRLGGDAADLYHAGAACRQAASCRRTTNDARRRSSSRQAVAQASDAARKRWRSSRPTRAARRSLAPDHPLPDLLHGDHLAQAAARYLSHSPRCCRVGATAQNYVELLTRAGLPDRTSATACWWPAVATIDRVVISCLAAYSLVRAEVSLPRLDRPADPVRVPDAGLAAVHPAVDHHRPAQARQLAARADLCLPDLLGAAEPPGC